MSGSCVAVISSGSGDICSCCQRDSSKADAYWVF